MCRAIRVDIFNSPISLLKFKKFLHELNASFETLSKDIEIRFNSILKLLKQILGKYEIILRFYCKLVSLSAECRQYTMDMDKYKSAKDSYDKLMQQRERQRQIQQMQQNFNRNANSRSTNVSDHVNSMLGLNRAPLQKPVPPTIPPILKRRNNLLRIPRLLLIALFIDYMDLFDSNSKKTGSKKWFKSLTLKQVNKIEISLRKWKKQTFNQPQSPTFKSVLQSLSRNQVLLTHI